MRPRRVPPPWDWRRDIGPAPGLARPRGAGSSLSTAVLTAAFTHRRNMAVDGILGAAGGHSGDRGRTARHLATDPCPAPPAPSAPLPSSPIDGPSSPAISRTETRPRTHTRTTLARGQRPEHADQKKELRTPVLRYRAFREALMHVRCAPRSGFACGHALPTPMRAGRQIAVGSARTAGFGPQATAGVRRHRGRRACDSVRDVRHGNRFWVPSLQHVPPSLPNSRGGRRVAALDERPSAIEKPGFV